MIGLVEAAIRVQTFSEQRDWPFCIIGGVALQAWGENRLTLDADFTLLTGIGLEEKFIDTMIEKFSSRIADARNFALRYRVLLLEIDNIGIDSRSVRPTMRLG